MNHITNTIEIEYNYFLIEVKYNWRKGHPGDWLQPPDEDTIDLEKVNLIGYINEDGSIEDLNIDFLKRANNNDPYLPKGIEEAAIEEIKMDIDNFR